MLRVTRCWVVGGPCIANAGAYLDVYRYPVGLQMHFARLEASAFPQ